MRRIRNLFCLLRCQKALVEQIISSHHKVYGAGELLTLRKVVDPVLSNHLEKDKPKMSRKDLLLIREQYLDYLSKLNTSEISELPIFCNSKESVVGKPCGEGRCSMIVQVTSLTEST